MERWEFSMKTPCNVRMYQEHFVVNTTVASILRTNKQFFNQNRNLHKRDNNKWEKIHNEDEGDTGEDTTKLLKRRGEKR